MATNDLVQTRVDRKVKEKAADVLEALGLTVSSAVRLLLIKIAEEGKLPFEPTVVPNKETLAALEEARGGDLEEVTLDELREQMRAHD